MAQRVQLPDGRIAEFPDEMQRGEIEAVLQKQFGSQPTREQAAQGATLKFGPLDTGVPLPQGVTEFLAGLGRHYTNIGTLGNREAAPEADALLDSSGYATAGALAADLSTLLAGGAFLKGVSALPQVAAAAPKVASALKTAGQAMTLPQSLAQATTAGAAYGGATTSGGVGERVKGAAQGLAGGAIGYGAPKVLGRIIQPAGGAAGAQELADAGIRLTPGQRLGGAANKIEQRAMSIPMVGDAVAAARTRSIEDFNRAAVNRALEPIGVKVPATVGAGRDLIQFADDALEQAYNKVVPKLTAQFDATLNTDLGDALQIAAGGNKAEQFKTLLADKLLSRFDQNGTIKAQTLKKAEGELKRLARQYMKSPDADQQALGQALQAARDALMEGAARHSPQGAAQELVKVNRAFAQFLRPEVAAGRVGAKEGVFTPAQLSSAVRELSGGVRKSQYAKGEALMQDLANNAERLLSTTVPNSGTPERLMLAGGLGALSYMEPNALAAALMGAAAYTRPGVATLNALLARRPRTAMILPDIARGLELSAPAGGLAGLAGANALVNALQQ